VLAYVAKEPSEDLKMEEQPLYNHLALLRTTAGLSQQQLADAIVVSRKTIITIETGRFTPSVLLALQLAAFYQLPLEQLFNLQPFTE